MRDGCQGGFRGKMGGVYLCPRLDDGEDFRGCEVRECEVVGGREDYYVAFACDGFCAEEEVREVCEG